MEATEETEEVKVEEASDEDLDAFLTESAKPVEAKEPAEKPAETVEEAPPKPVAEESKAPKEPEKAAPQTDSPAATTVTREEYEKLQRQVKGQELLLQRRTSELGNIKKQLSDLIEEKSKGLQERFQEDPARATQDMWDVREAQAKMQQLAQEEAALEHEKMSRAMFQERYKENEVTVDDLSKMLEADGVDPSYLQQFRANPWRSTYPGELLQLAERTKLMKQFALVASFAKGLLEENKKLKEKPAEVVKTISRNLRQPPAMTAATGGGGGGTPTIDPTRMSDAEIEEFLRSNR